MTNDFDEKNIQELEEYFGTKIIPKNVGNFTLSSKSRFGYYRGNRDGNEKIYYDQNIIIYENSLNNQKLEIVVSKIRKPYFDYDVRKEDSSLYEMSIINNFELPIFNFSYKDGDVVNCYYTTFEKHSVYFDINGYNLNINNFVTIIASIVDDAIK